MNGKTSGLFCAIACFVDESGTPVQGKGWTARVSDQDTFLDDHLGTVKLDNEGKATFLLSVADMMSVDSPGERNPDLYFTLLHDGEEVFRSTVSEDVDFESLHEVSGDPVRITQEFGPYVVSLR